MTEFMLCYRCKKTNLYRNHTVANKEYAFGQKLWFELHNSNLYTDVHVVKITRDGTKTVIWERIDV